jgi:hypothetical protein
MTHYRNQERGEGYEARGKTFLLIPPRLWPRASSLNFIGCSRAFVIDAGYGGGTFTLGTDAMVLGQTLNVIPPDDLTEPSGLGIPSEY